MSLGIFINLASLALGTAVVMDSYFWVTRRYMIPCWTMAVMSLGMILILQVVRVQVR